MSYGRHRAAEPDDEYPELAQPVYDALAAQVALTFRDGQ